MSKLKVINSLIIFFLFSSNLLADNYQLKSSSLNFQIDINTGGVQSIINRQDKYQMNWIIKSDSIEYPWQTSKLTWGLGFGIINGDTVRWNKPTSHLLGNNQCSFHYHTKYFDLIVDRKLDKNGFYSESFRFVNITTKPITISDIGLYTPFNDNYPDAKTCVESRCNTHIWAGGNASYIFAERMGGEAPHLGLVLTEGALKSYEILNRSRNIYEWAKSGSNVRGTIVLNPSSITIRPKQSYSLKWVIFQAANWDNFYAKAKIYGFVNASVKSYVMEKNEPLQTTFESAQKLKNVQCFLNGEKVPFTQTSNTVSVNVIPKKEGTQVLNMVYNNNLSTFIEAYRIQNIDSLLKKRALFIVNNQQMNDPSDPRYGAYMVYDNETHKIYLNNDKRKSEDVNEARERVGMGVFLAMYLQRNPNKMIQASLERYCDFVRNKLQTNDYYVLDGINSKRKRMYNYPWVAHLYLEMYKLTQNKKYLVDSYHTLDRYFTDSKHCFYAIGVPAQDALNELHKAGLLAEHDSLLNHFRQTADRFIQTSLFYPKSEVNYEQSIVAPAVIFLFEMYQITKEEKYLKEGERQLAALESFCGMQPDYHLHEIAIRHWDGYWFGKREFWGDTMPHYWSCTTSDAFMRYAQITCKNEYLNRAKTIVRNNLCLFFNDGSASCAYVYPSKVNGQKAAFFDPFANDQDWALVYYLKLKNKVSDNF